MNSSQIRFTQSVNGRQPQIIANNTIVQQQNTPSSNMVLLRQPISHATTNPNAVSVHGSTTVRSLVVSQPSNRPLATNVTGTTGANVQMYVAQQPVSILPRGGLRATNAPSSTISQAPSAAVTVQSAHATSGIAVSTNDSGTAVTNPRTIQSGTTIIRPKIENSVTTVGTIAANNPRVHGSEDPAILAQVHKCHSFLSCLIRFSDSVEKRKNLVSIMQELIDGKITVLDFMERITDCLKSNSQLPQLRPFLEMVLPHLRREMYAGKLSFEGEELRAPPLTALQTRSQAAQPQPITATAVQRHQPQHTTQHAQIVQAAPQNAQNASLRQPLGTVAIHSSGGHQMSTQRPQTPSVPNQRTIAVSNMPSQGLRALHPRPAPILTTVNTGQQQQQSILQQHQHTCAKPVNSNISSTINIVPHGTSSTTVAGVPGNQVKRITPRTQASVGEDYEEYNDVAMMGGVNLTEESRNILPTVSGPTTASSRTCKEQMLVPISTLRNRILKHARGITNISDEAVALVSHALEERLKNLFTHLSVAVEHRTTQYRECPLFEQETDVRGQIKFLEEIDRAEKVRHDDEERAALIKAARHLEMILRRSRSRNENMDHIKMKEKARLMMQKEYEMEKQREANITALAAIGTRKKRKLDTDFNQLSNDASSLRTPGNSGYGPGMGGGSKGDGPPAKRIIRRATMKDLVHVMERDPTLKRSQLMWKAIFK